MIRIFWSLLLVCVVGCQAPPDLAPVSGKITIAGQPPQYLGQITFYPTDGRRAAIGIVQPDGTFKLTTFKDGDGAFVGEHRVAIAISRQETPTPKGKGLTGEGAVPSGVVWIVPEQYADETKSGLTATVERVERNEIDFPLP